MGGPEVWGGAGTDQTSRPLHTARGLLAVTALVSCENMSDDETYPGVTELTGISDGMKQRMNDEGFFTIFDVAGAQDYELEQVKGIGAEKANGLINESKDILDEDHFVNRQWNPITGEYEDVEQDIFNCEYCGRPYPQRSIWRGHMETCSENPKNG